MSVGTLEEIIRKAVVDAEFREALFSDPDKALEGYELTDEEAEKLRGMEPDFFDAQAGELEERISRWGSGLGSGI
jgi:hypothetical protein